VGGYGGEVVLVFVQNFTHETTKKEKKHKSYIIKIVGCQNETKTKNKKKKKRKQRKNVVGQNKQKRYMHNRNPRP